MDSPVSGDPRTLRRSNAEDLSSRWPKSLRRRFASAMLHRTRKRWPYSPWGPDHDFGIRFKYMELARVLFATGWRKRFAPCPSKARPQEPSNTRSHWRALTRYVDNGLLEIDNCAAERSLRAVVMGRKNYLFMGSDEGGSYCPSRYLLIN
jgi:hypothetical protein